MHASPDQSQATPGASIRLSSVNVDVFDASLATTVKARIVRGSAATVPGRRRILESIDFAASPGERIGVIGRNGCGKTTLLKVIAGIYPPASGTRRIAGHIAPAIASGVGFDPESTVVDNIGLVLAHMDRLDQLSSSFISDVISFAELDGRETTPLKFLSSGFRGRLAFAITLFQRPDILLLDEILAAGDAMFVEKAEAAMIGRMHATPICLFVSHDDRQILAVCNRVILLQSGRIVADGLPEPVLAEYHARLRSSQLQSAGPA